MTQGFESGACTRRILALLVCFLGLVVKFKCILKWLVGPNRLSFAESLTYELAIVQVGHGRRRCDASSRSSGTDGWREECGRPRRQVMEQMQMSLRPSPSPGEMGMGMAMTTAMAMTMTT